MHIYIHLLAREDQTLLLRWNALFLFDALLDAIDFVGWLNIDFDLLAGERLLTNTPKMLIVDDVVWRWTSARKILPSL